MNKIILFILILSLLFSLPNSKKNCVTCHITWSNELPHDFLKKENSHHILDGIPSLVSTKEMCYSCHDGYVVDSRKYFIDEDNHLGEKIEITNLPLNNQNKIYCGTCHTPHNSEMVETISYAPFLRENINDSQLCISCHENNILKHNNHPIHVKQNNFPKALATSKVNENVECMTCHNIHNHQPTKLTIEHNSSTLCNECHSNQFAIELSDHDFRYLENGNSINDICSGCHLVHERNENFLWANNLTENNNSFCLNCHSEKGLGKNKLINNHAHPIDTKIIKECIDPEISENNREIQCLSCHNPHEWSNNHFNLTETNEEGNSLTSFLKIPDDSNGTLCISCHQNESDIIYSDHSTKREGFQNILFNEQDNKGQCTVCHNTHSDDYQFTKDTIEVSKTTTLCLACHENNDLITNIGSHSHPIGVEFPKHSLLPGIKNNDNIIGCETCHDPHKWGQNITENNGHDLNGDGASSFLRIPTDVNSDLCGSCHTKEMAVNGSKHDLSIMIDNSTNKNACSGCHSTHNAISQHDLLDTLAINHKSIGEQHCLSCHEKNGIAEKMIPEISTHPIKNIFLKFLPNLLSKNTKLKTIDCLTCHDPHYWSFNKNFNNNNSFIKNGNIKTSFLKEHNYESNCQECHDINGIWKYLYFHDTEKRKQF